MTDEQRILAAELQEEIDAASLLLDDRVYTNESYFALVRSVGCAKVALENGDGEEMQAAIDDLQKTVDEMIPREEAPAQKKSTQKRNIAPALIVGAAVGGFLLGRHLSKKKRK